MNNNVQGQPLAKSLEKKNINPSLVQQNERQTNQQVQPQVVEEQAYRLVSAIPERPHHILKITGSRTRFDLNSFSKPIKLVRDIPQSHLNRRMNYLNNSAASSTAASSTETKDAADTPGNNSKTASSSVNGKDGKNADSSAPQTENKLDTSKIAPFGHAQKNKINLFKKRTKQVYLGADDSSRDKSIQEIKKEKEAERYPWLLTDFDNNITNTYTGQLEGGQHANYVLFMFSDDGFRVIPASKWYKFTPKLTYQTLTIEEAETKLAKAKIEQDRWMMRKKIKPEESEEIKKEDIKISNEFKISDRDDNKLNMDEDDNDEKPRRRTVNPDEDDLDFDEEFQDDEEPLFGIDNDEETKESEKKQSEQIKILNRTDDFSDDDENSEEDDTKLTTTGKEMKKIVKKIEKSIVFDSDDDKNPYASSDSEDSDDYEEDTQNENNTSEQEKEDGKSKSVPNSNVSTPTNHQKTHSEKKKDNEHKKSHREKHSSSKSQEANAKARASSDESNIKIKLEHGTSKLKSQKNHERKSSMALSTNSNDPGEIKSKSSLNSKKRLSDDNDPLKKDSGIKKIKIKMEDSKKHKHESSSSKPLKKVKKEHHSKDEKEKNPNKSSKKSSSNNSEQIGDITEIELVNIIKDLQPIKTRTLIGILQPTILKRNPKNRKALPKILAKLVKKNEDETIELRARVMEQYKIK